KTRASPGGGDILVPSTGAYKIHACFSPGASSEVPCVLPNHSAFRQGGGELEPALVESVLA
ncbi:unnamed protein product, partial [Urochloa humidicola]